MKTDKKTMLKFMDLAKIGTASKELVEQSASYVFTGEHMITYNDEVSVKIPFKTDFSGSVNAEEFTAFFKKAPGDEIEIQTISGEIVLKAGKSKAGLTLKSEIKLPFDEVPKATKWVAISPEMLSAVDFCATVVSKNMLKPTLTCIHIFGETIEASDGFRIAKYTLADAKLPDLLIPATSFTTIIKYAPNRISAGDGWAHFKTEDEAIISCRIFSDKFPDTESVLKENRKGMESRFPNELKEVLERAAIFAKQDNWLDELITFEISEGKLAVSSKSNVGWFSEKIRFNYKGAEKKLDIIASSFLHILENENTVIINENMLYFTGAGWEYLTMLKG